MFLSIFVFIVTYLMSVTGYDKIISCWYMLEFNIVLMFIGRVCIKTDVINILTYKDNLRSGEYILSKQCNKAIIG